MEIKDFKKIAILTFKIFLVLCAFALCFKLRMMYDKEIIKQAIEETNE